MIVVGAAVAISTIFLVYVLATGYATNAANLRRGQELNFSFLDNPLQLRATTLDLDWAGTRPEIVRYCNCSIHYLGHANSLAVLYDSTHDRTLRIPESDLRFRSTP